MWYIGCSWRAIDFPCAWLTTSLGGSSNSHLEEDVCKNCADQRDYIDSSINLSATPSSIGPNEAKERDDDEPVQCNRPYRQFLLEPLVEEQHDDEKGGDKRSCVADKERLVAGGAVVLQNWEAHTVAVAPEATRWA